VKEEDIIEQCKKEKSYAQKELYDIYAPKLRGVCRRYIIDTEESEDLLQNVFVQIFFNIQKFSWQGKGSLYAWAKRITINMAINHLKKNKNKWYEEAFDECNELDIQSEEEENIFNDNLERFSKQAIIEAFYKVPEPYSIVLNMYILDGMKHKEIAEILEIAEQTSRSRLTRGKKIFKEILITSEQYQQQTR